MSYKVSVVIEKDENGYYAYCPELDGCHSQGDTFEEVTENIKEAIDLYLEGDYGQMREVTAHFSKTGGVNDVLLSIACSSLGDRECTREALARVSEFKPLARDPAAYFRRHGATDEITGALANGLAKARRFADQAEIAGE